MSRQCPCVRFFVLIRTTPFYGFGVRILCVVCPDVQCTKLLTIDILLLYVHENVDLDTSKVYVTDPYIYIYSNKTKPDLANSIRKKRANNSLVRIGYINFEVS